MSTRELALELEIEGGILLGEIKDAIRDILIVQSTTEATAKGRMVALGDDREERLDKSNRCIARLEFWLERIMLHGLKSPPVKGSFWHVIEKLPDSLPGTEKIVKQVSSISKNSIARGRIFIRSSLNESSIQPHLSALMWNQDVMSLFYGELSLMRNEEQCSTLLMLLEPLNTIQFNLTFKEKDLDKPSYWEKYITPELMSIVKQRKYSRSAEPPAATPSTITQPMEPSKPKKEEDKKKSRRRTIVLPDEEKANPNNNGVHSETTPVSIPQSSSTMTSPIQSFTDNGLSPNQSDTDNGSYRTIYRTGSTHSEATEMDEVDDLVNRIMTTKQPELSPQSSTSYNDNQSSLPTIDDGSFSKSYLANSDNYSSPDYPSYLDETKPPQKGNDNSVFNDFVFVAELPPPVEEQETIISNIYKIKAEHEAAERSMQKTIQSTKQAKDSKPPGNYLHSFQIIEDYEPNTSKDLQSYSESVVGFDMDFPPKSTLYNQNYECAGCNAKLPMGFWKHKYCYYTAKYYCRNCQKDDKSVIPVRLVRKLDRKEYPVCVAAKSHILSNQRKPLIHVNMINPLLYEWDSNLATIKRLRVQMLYIGEFVLTCRNNEKLLALIGSREHLLHNVHIYSLMDLVDPKGLLDFLCNVMEKYILHITQQCETCRGKGHYCELCKKDQILFAFQFKLIVKCRKCRAIYHKSCVKDRQKDKAFQCPKCQRVEHYSSKHL